MRAPAEKEISGQKRMLQKTEAMLNERLASAAATLQTYKMQAINGVAPTLPKPPRPSAGGREPDRALKLQGEQVPSSNERLGLILSDLML